MSGSLGDTFHKIAQIDHLRAGVPLRATRHGVESRFARNRTPEQRERDLHRATEALNNLLAAESIGNFARRLAGPPAPRLVVDNPPQPEPPRAA